jgi:4-aminobutyrate aminotransferase-like enzyme
MKFKLPGPKSMEYIRKGVNLFPGGASENYLSDVEPYGAYVVDKTYVSWIEDLDGNRYIDFMSGWAYNNVGNVHPEVVEATVEALKRYGFSYSHKLRYDLAEKLVEITPPELTRISFEISGTEAAEAGVSYAVACKKRPNIISFLSQYHGDSIAARNLGAVTADRRSFFEALHGGGVILSPYPVSYKIPFGLSYEEYGEYCLEFIEKQVLKYRTTPDRVSAILFEPMVAEGGNWLPPDNFIKGLRRLADEHDWLLVCDEVLTGFGRTGKMWAIEHYGVKVDLMIIGKGLTGGVMPIAAVAGSDEVMGETHAYSGSTFAGCPPGCAAGLKTIEVMEREKLSERAGRLGGKALKRIREWVDEYEIVGDARGVGFLLGVSIVTDKKTEALNVDLARKIVLEATKNGVKPIWDAEPQVRIYPPLTIEEDLLEEGLTKLEEAVKYVS